MRGGIAAADGQVAHRRPKSLREVYKWVTRDYQPNRPVTSRPAFWSPAADLAVLLVQAACHPELHRLMRVWFLRLFIELIIEETCEISGTGSKHGIVGLAWR